MHTLVWQRSSKFHSSRGLFCQLPSSGRTLQTRSARQCKALVPECMEIQFPSSGKPIVKVISCTWAAQLTEGGPRCNMVSKLMFPYWTLYAVPRGELYYTAPGAKEEVLPWGYHQLFSWPVIYPRALLVLGAPKTKHFGKSTPKELVWRLMDYFYRLTYPIYCGKEFFSQIWRKSPAKYCDHYRADTHYRFLE